MIHNSMAGVCWFFVQTPLDSQPLHCTDDLPFYLAHRHLHLHHNFHYELHFDGIGRCRTCFWIQFGPVAGLRRIRCPRSHPPTPVPCTTFPSPKRAWANSCCCRCTNTQSPITFFGQIYCLCAVVRAHAPFSLRKANALALYANQRAHTHTHAHRRAVYTATNGTHKSRISHFIRNVLELIHFAKCFFFGRSPPLERALSCVYGPRGCVRARSVQYVWSSHTNTN